MKCASFRKGNFLLNFGMLLVVVLTSASVAWAQTGTTSLHGVVTDKSGATVAAAKVTLQNPELGLTRNLDSGSAGEFDFVALPPGTYVLQVEASGFRRFERKNLQLLVNTPTTVNVMLEVGSSTQTVEVSAAAETLNTTDASLGQAFSTRQVMELPLEAGNVPELLSLQAGVAYTGNRTDIDKDTDTRNGAVNGARSDQSNITLDGVDVNADTKGYAFTSVLPITQDSVQEFRVTTSNYNADEGRSSGAQVALVTKSGTNEFHGSGFWSHRNTYTSANDYFVKLAELQSGAPNQPPKLLRNNFGGALGGPLKKDHLFFFINYEGHRQREAESVVRIVPSATMQDGVILYPCADPTACPGGTVQGLTASHAVPTGDFGLGPAQIQGMDPQGIGVSTSVMIPYFKTFAPFQANDTSVGDGLNFVGYRFKGPIAINTNWYIARMDYKVTSNGNHSLFWRGALRNDQNGVCSQSCVPYLPGQPPELSNVDYSKGFSAGYVAVLRQNLVNNFRYGYTRQSFGEIGNQTGDQVFFRNLNDNAGPGNSSLAVTNNQTYQVPVHNIVDDISWIKGRHTLAFGTNINFLRNPQSNNNRSFTEASDNPSWLDTAAMANTGVAGHFDPGCSTGPGACGVGPAYPAVDPNFGNSYDYPLGALIGMITQVNARYNYTKTGSVLPDGTPVTRRFADDSYEFYAQDTWKIKPTLTLTLGLRYSLFSPPWETNGLQVVPTRSLSDYFSARGLGMLQGQPSSAQCCLSFELGGPANHAPGFYNWDYKDFGPHVAFAYSPRPQNGFFRSLFGDGDKTVIRGGFGMVYDRIGPELLATFNTSGSFGLSTTLTNTGGIETPASAPRATCIVGAACIPSTDLNGVPLLTPAPPGTFPQTFPSGLSGDTGSYAVYFGMDNKLKTPYAYTIDLSVGRELGHNFALQVAYVGRLSHRLLSQEDVAAPLDLVDPATHIDYYTAVQALAKMYRAGVPVSSITPASVGPTAQYWNDILQTSPSGMYNAPGFCGAPTVSTPLQAAYNLFSCFSLNETTAVQFLDQGIGLSDPATGNPIYAKGGPYTFVDPQFAALYSWRSIGAAAYNGLQINLQRHMSHGVQFDFNYTYSKSIDISSDANRITDEGGLGGQVILPWNPKALRAVSDFDLTHQVNANWIWELPFGKGRWIGSDAHGFTDAVIGGWQLSGLARWTSGFPIGVGNGAQWPTNWELSGFATTIGQVQTHGAVKTAAGAVNLFGDTTTALNVLNNNYAADLPGQVGNRNNLRGDGFAGLDLGLSKRWRIKESRSLQFRWDVFNALNLTRFDVQSLSLSLTNSSSFGNYTGLLTNPRVMQFMLRFEF
jgi:Carboxypeptidase regulatory-like domain